MGVFTSQPTAYVNAGIGIPWQSPLNASGTGIGSQSAAVVNSVTISANVATFTTVTQAVPLVAGQSVDMSLFQFNTFLNGATLVVLSAGLSATQFSANFIHADLGSTADAGVAIPTTHYAFAQNLDAITPAPGQHVLYAFTDGSWTNASGSGLVFDVPWAYSIYGPEIGGANGGFNEPEAGSFTSVVTVPTIPAGARILGVYPVAIGNKFASGPVFMVFSYDFPGSAGSFTLNGTWQVGHFIDFSELSVGRFVLKQQSTVSSFFEYGASIQAFAIAIVYDFPSGGTPPPADQLQTLEGTNCGFAIPASTIITGMEVALNTGIAYGSTCTLEVQLTLAGTPIGTAKTVVAGPWATPYVLGSQTDLWGTAGFTAAQINGSSGIGVNVSGTLDDGTQVDLNSVEIAVHGHPVRPTVWVSIGTTRSPAM